MTVAGAHGKFAPSLATSTPRRSVAPGGLNIFNPNENEFNFNCDENDSIFNPSTALKENLPLSNNCGSSLQRRLNLVIKFFFIVNALRLIF